MRVKKWIMTIAALALLTQSASARLWRESADSGSEPVSSG
jgi:hypothetical protein